MKPAPKLLTTAFLLHFILPALIVADFMASWMRKLIPLRLASPGALMVGLCLLWLIAGLGFFFLSRDRQAFLRKSISPLIAVYTTYTALIFLEGMARLIGSAPPIPHLFPPGLKVVTNQPSKGPGLSGTKTFTINRMGFRGPLPPLSDRTYRIMAIGGSTTLCEDLDDSEEWPHLVMEDINAARPGRPVWVGNAGRAGLNTVSNLVLTQWLPGIVHVDMIVFLFGGNDLNATLAFEGGPTQKQLEKDAGFEGNLPPGRHWRTENLYPLYRRLRLAVLLRETAEAVKQRFQGTNKRITADMNQDRKRRAQSPVVPLPDLSIGLREYRGRIQALAARCRDLEIRCLFMTQPAMARDDLTAYEKSLFWLGYVGKFEKPKGYISTENIARAFAMYNGTLLDVCREASLECYDAASHIPKTTEAFFDDEHFNTNGARLMARNVAQYLLSKSPLKAD